MIRVRILGLALLLGGCLGDRDNDGLATHREGRFGTDPDNPDSDGDRLLDGDEIELGTDPLVYDSDNDGYADGDEVAEGSDPLDPDDRIYTGGWPYQHAKEELGAPGFDSEVALGATIPRLVGVDAFGDQVDLYDYAQHGVPVIIDIATRAITRSPAIGDWRQDPDTNPFNYGWDLVRDALKDGRILWVTVLSEGEEYLSEPTATDAMEWGQAYPDVAVILDETREFRHWATEQGLGGFAAPTFIWATNDMRVRRIDRSTDPSLHYTLNLLEQHLLDEAEPP